jgi:hypothetical protein
MTNPDTLIEVEHAALKVLHQELARPMAVIESLYVLTGRCLNQIPPRPVALIPLAERVTNTLMKRLTNDVRAAELLAERGYALQAATIAAAAFEAAYTIAAIGNDEKEAKRWIEHQDPREFFLKPNESVTNACLKLEIPADMSQDVYDEVYRNFLAPFKHSNPTALRRYGYRPEDGRMQNGPDTSAAAIQDTWLVLEQIAWSVIIAMRSFAKYHLPSASEAYFNTGLKKVFDELSALQAEARSRWAR